MIFPAMEKPGGTGAKDYHLCSLAAAICVMPMSQLRSTEIRLKLRLEFRLAN
jgi:hypothetical protein